MLGALFAALKDLFADKASRLMTVLAAYTTMVFAERLNLKAGVDLIRRTVEEWGRDRAAGMAAGLAYYAIFSIAPALIIVIALAGIVFGQEQIQQQIVAQVQGALGPESAELVETMIAGLRGQQRSGIIATAIGVVTLVFGSIGAFGHLHGSLNAIWGVQPDVRPGLGGVLVFLKGSVISFAIVVSASFLLVLFVILNTVLSVARDYLAGAVSEVGSVLPPPNLLLSFGAITALVAMIFKILPDVDLKWRDVWPGAVLTALLFIAGQFFVNLYLSTSSLASVYGAAGSIIAILVWVYYSAQIFMLGAEFTKVYARTYGSHRAVAAQNQPPPKKPRRSRRRRNPSKAPG